MPEAQPKTVVDVHPAAPQTVPQSVLNIDTAPQTVFPNETSVTVQQSLASEVINQMSTFDSDAYGGSKGTVSPKARSPQPHVLGSPVQLQEFFGIREQLELEEKLLFPSGRSSRTRTRSGSIYNTANNSSKEKYGGQVATAVEQIEGRSRNQSKDRDSCTVDSGDVGRPTGYHSSVLRDKTSIAAEETVNQA